MKQLEWKKVETEPEMFVSVIKIENWAGRFNGTYELLISQRPNYCDRGDWLMMAESSGASLPLDSQDGFPRYFFGSEEEVKEQFQRWANRRKEIQ